MSVSSDSTITDRPSGNRQPVPLGEASGPSVIAAPRISPTDGELLTLFVRHDDRAALDRLVDRHAAMVWRVCRATLRRSQDAEDAFQATFLLLVRSARSIKSSDSAAGWLYRVAYRTSLRARKKLAARREESLAVDPDAPGEAAFPDLLRRQTTGVLVEELMRLPAKYQTPLVMRYLEGQSRRAIADQTDTTIAAVQGQLARGKQMLRHRLLRRGVSLATTMAALGLGARGAKAAETAPAHLVASTTTHSVALASGGSLAASAAIVSLYQEGARAMLIAWLGKPAASIAAAAVVALMLLPNAPAGEGIGSPAPEPLSLSLAMEGEAAASQPTPILQLAQTQPEPPAIAVGNSPTDPASDKPASPRRQSGEDQPAPAPTTGVAGSPQPPESRNEPTLAFNDHPEISVWGGASKYSLAGTFWIDSTGTAQLAGTTDEPIAWLKPIDGIGGLTLEQAANRIATELRERTGDRRLRVRLSHKLLGVAGNGQLSAAAPPATAPQPPAAPPKTSPPVPPQPPAAAAPQLTPLRAPEGGGAGKYAERNREYGWSVQQLQERLNTRLNPSPDLDADGDYGPKTEGAVKRLQRQNDLPITGFADQATLSAMGLGRVNNSAGSPQDSTPAAEMTGSSKSDQSEAADAMSIAELDRSVDRVTDSLKQSDLLTKRAYKLFIASRDKAANAIYQPSLPTPTWSELQSLAAPDPMERALWVKSQTLYQAASEQIDEINQKAAELLAAVDPDGKSSLARLEKLSMLALRLVELQQRSPLKRFENAEAYFADVWKSTYKGKTYFAVAKAVTGKASFSTVAHSVKQLKEFQEENGLKPTGELDEATWNALFGLGGKPSDQPGEASAAEEPPVNPPTTGVAGSPSIEEATAKAPPTEPEPAPLDEIEQLMATAEAESAKLVSLARQTLKMLAFEKPGKTSLIGDTFSNESRIVNAPLTSALVETGRQQRVLAEQAWDAAQQAIKEYGKERLQSAESGADVAPLVASLQADLAELNQRLKALQRDHASVSAILSGREAVSTPPQTSSLVDEEAATLMDQKKRRIAREKEKIAAEKDRLARQQERLRQAKSAAAETQVSPSAAEVPYGPVHVVGTYFGNQGAPLTVEVAATDEPITLVLSAYDWQDWKLNLQPGAKLARVIVAGYYAQRVEGVREALPDGVPLEVFTYFNEDKSNNKGKETPYFWAYKKTSQNYFDLAKKLKEITGRKIESFNGAYKAERFVVDEKKPSQPVGKAKLTDAEIGARLAEGWRKFFAQDAKGAEQAFRDVLQSQPDNSSGTNGLAFCLLNRGEPAQAEPLFNKLLEDEPNAPGPLNELARCLQARGDTDGAINAWEKSRSGMAPGQPSAATAALARVYSERADWDKARPLLEEMLASNPNQEPYAGWLKKAEAAMATAAESGSAEGEAPPLFAEPTVIKTVPARDATNVDPGLKEIRITFDRDMGRGMSWTGSKETGMPSIAAGRSARWIDKRTCVLSVKLEPGRTYRVGINSPSFKNFKSADGKPAAIDELKFTTSSEVVPTASRRRESSEVSRTGTTQPAVAPDVGSAPRSGSSRDVGTNSGRSGASLGGDSPPPTEKTLPSKLERDLSDSPKLVTIELEYVVYRYNEDRGGQITFGEADFGDLKNPQRITLRSGEKFVAESETGEHSSAGFFIAQKEGKLTFSSGKSPFYATDLGEISLTSLATITRMPLTEDDNPEICDNHVYLIRLGQVDRYLLIRARVLKPNGDKMSEVERLIDDYNRQLTVAADNLDESEKLREQAASTKSKTVREALTKVAMQNAEAAWSLCQSISEKRIDRLITQATNESTTEDGVNLAKLEKVLEPLTALTTRRDELLEANWHWDPSGRARQPGSLE